MSLPVLSDESLLRFYENIRIHTEADLESRRRGYRHLFVNNDSSKRYVASLCEEMNRRRLHYAPIAWL